MGYSSNIKIGVVYELKPLFENPRLNRCPSHGEMDYAFCPKCGKKTVEEFETEYDVIFDELINDCPIWDSNDETGNIFVELFELPNVSLLFWPVNDIECFEQSYHLPESTTVVEYFDGLYLQKLQQKFEIVGKRPTIGLYESY